METIALLIDVIIAIATLAALWFTYQNLKEIKNQFYEQNRGQVIFYIKTHPDNPASDLIVKNFGNSPVELFKISTTPALKWERGELPLITDCTDIFLAPNQVIKSTIILPDKKNLIYNVELEYHTCGKTYITNYKIDLRFTTNILSAETQFTNKDLKHLTKTIQEFSDKFI